MYTQLISIECTRIYRTVDHLIGVKRRVRRGEVVSSTSCLRADSAVANTNSFDWFREHYEELHGEMAAETEQWGEEMTVLTRRG